MTSAPRSDATVASTWWARPAWTTGITRSGPMVVPTASRRRRAPSSATSATADARDGSFHDAGAGTSSAYTSTTSASGASRRAAHCALATEGMEKSMPTTIRDRGVWRS